MHDLWRNAVIATAMIESCLFIVCWIYHCRFMCEYIVFSVFFSSSFGLYFSFLQSFFLVQTHNEQTSEAINAEATAPYITVANYVYSIFDVCIVLWTTLMAVVYAFWTDVQLLFERGHWSKPLNSINLKILQSPRKWIRFAIRMRRGTFVGIHTIDFHVICCCCFIVSFNRYTK